MKHMNHMQMALKKKMMDMKSGSHMEDSEAHGEMDKHMGDDEKKGDEIAGNAPSLDMKKADMEAKNMRDEEEQPNPEQGDVGHMDDRAKMDLLAKEHGEVPKDQREELDPDMHMEILKGMMPKGEHKGRGPMSLRERAGAGIKAKMASLMEMKSKKA